MGKGGLPCSPAVKLHASTAKGMGSIPGQGTKIPRAMDQLSPSTTTAEPVCSRARLPQLGTVRCSGRFPHDVNKTQWSQINVEGKKERKCY